eukprot:4216528-Pleurochrysis_carterae.AAC.1
MSPPYQNLRAFGEGSLTRAPSCQPTERKAVQESSHTAQDQRAGEQKWNDRVDGQEGNEGETEKYQKREEMRK